MEARTQARIPPQGIAGLAGWLAVLVLLAGMPVRAEPEAAAEAVAPDGSGGSEAAALLRATPPPTAPVVVRLAFPATADLDLYVTGPLAETVYFANSPSRIGGRLEADRRCDSPGPPLETIVYPELRPGEYRVGVDYPEGCEGRRDRVEFAIEVRTGSRHELHVGTIEPGVFLPRVFEWRAPEPD